MIPFHAAVGTRPRPKGAAVKCERRGETVKTGCERLNQDGRTNTSDLQGGDDSDSQSRTRDKQFPALEAGEVIGANASMEESNE